MISPTENPFIVQETRKQRIFRYIIFTIMVLLAPALIVIRLSLFIGIMFFQLIVFRIIDFGSRYPAPLGRFRLFLYSIFSKLIGLLLLLTMGFIPIVTRKGLRRQHKDAKCIVMNHSGLLDIPVAQYAIVASPVAKQSLYNSFFLRGLLRASRCILVKRETEQLKSKLEKKVGVSQTTTQLMQERVKYGPVAVMAEGTIPAPHYLLKFKTGIFRLDAPIQPVSFKFCSPIQLTWTTHSLLYAAFLMIINPVGIVFITYHDVIYPKPGQDPIELAEIARTAMAKQLKAKKVEYQNNDFIYFKSGKGNPTKEWVRDFGWMKTCNEFSKKYHLNSKTGMYTWQVQHIKPEEEYYYSSEYQKLCDQIEKPKGIETANNTAAILNLKEVQSEVQQ